jgi:hypothetical protein
MAFTSCPHCGKPLAGAVEAAGNCPACGKPLAAARATPPAIGNADSSPVPTGGVRELTFAPIQGAAEWGTVRAALGVLASGVLLLLVGVSYRLILIHATINPMAVIENSTLWINLIWETSYYAIIPAAVALCVAGVFMSNAAPRARGLVMAAAVLIIVAGLLVLAQQYLYKTIDLAHKDSHDEFSMKLQGLVKERLRSQGDPKKLAEIQRREDLARSETAARHDSILEDPWTSDVPPAIRYAYVSCLILAGVLYALFLWRVARHLHRNRLAACLMVYLVVCSILGIGAFLLTIVAEKSPSPNLASMAAMDPSHLGAGAFEPPTEDSGLKLGAQLFQGKWLLAWVGVLTAFCLWSIVNLFLVRGAIRKSVFRPSL